MNQKLIDYLPDLLTHFECVIIPQFGGFITENTSASITSGKIQPPTKSILFNPQLNHNDGLLANYIAQKENLSYNEALDEIKAEVEDWFNRLENNESIQIPKVGYFRLLNDHLIFKVDEDENYLIDSFGLSALKESAASRSAEEKESITQNTNNKSNQITESKETGNSRQWPVTPSNSTAIQETESDESDDDDEEDELHTPVDIDKEINTKFIWQILIALIIVLSAFTIYSLRDQIFNFKNKTEIVVDSNYNSYNDSLKLLEDTLKSVSENIDTASPKKPSIMSDVVPETYDSTNNVGIIELVDTSSIRMKGTYYCVAYAAFNNEREALLEQRQLEMVGFNSEVIKIKNGTRFQVVIGKYQKYADAVNELKFAKAIDKKFYLITVKDLN